MEPVGAISSVLALVSFASGSSKLIYNIVKDVREPSRTLYDLENAVGQLVSILEYVEHILQHAESKANEFDEVDSDFVKSLSRIVLECDKDLRSISLRLSSFASGADAGVFKHVRAAVKLSIKEKEIQRTRETIQHYSSLLTLHVQRFAINQTALHTASNAQLIKNIGTEASAKLHECLGKIESLVTSNARECHTRSERLQSYDKWQRCLSNDPRQDLLRSSADHQYNDDQSIISSNITRSKSNHRRSSRKKTNTTWTSIKHQLNQADENTTAQNRRLENIDQELKMIQNAIKMLSTKVNLSEQDDHTDHLTKEREEVALVANIQHLMRLIAEYQQGRTVYKMSSLISTLLDIIETAFGSTNLTDHAVEGGSHQEVNSVRMTCNALRLSPSLIVRDPSAPATIPTSSNHEMNSISDDDLVNRPRNEQFSTSQSYSVSQAASIHRQQTPLSQVAIPSLKGCFHAPCDEKSAMCTTSLRNRRTRKHIRLKRTLPQSLSQCPSDRAVLGTQSLKIFARKTSLGTIGLTSKRIRCMTSGIEDQELEHNIFETWQSHMTFIPKSEQPVHRQFTFSCYQRIGRYGHCLTLPINLTIRNTQSWESRALKLAAVGRVKDMALLLRSGQAYSTDCDPKGRSLLSYAFRNRNYPMIDFLIENGAEIDAYEVPHDCAGQNSCHDREKCLALIHKGTAVLRPVVAALDWIAVPDDGISEWSCIQSFIAALNHQCDLANTLDVRDRSGDVNVAILVFEKWHHLTTRLLLDHGSPYFTPNSAQGLSMSPLIHLASKSGCWHVRHLTEKLALLISRGASVLACNEDGNTALHLLLQFRTFNPRQSTFERRRKRDEELQDALSLLISAGADPLASNRNGETPCSIAGSNGTSLEWCAALKECGCDLAALRNLPTSDNTASSSAVDRPVLQSRASPLTFKEYLDLRRMRNISQDPGWLSRRVDPTPRAPGSWRWLYAQERWVDDDEGDSTLEDTSDSMPLDVI